MPLRPLAVLVVAVVALAAPPLAVAQGSPEVRDEPDDTTDPLRPELDIASADFRAVDGCRFAVDIVVRDLAAADADDGETRVWNAFWERGDDDRQDFAHAGVTLDPDRGWWFHVLNPAISMEYVETTGHVDVNASTLTVIVPYDLASIPPANGSGFTRTWATTTASADGQLASMGDWAPAGARPVFWAEYAFGLAPNQQPVAKLPDDLFGDPFDAPPAACWRAEELPLNATEVDMPATNATDPAPANATEAPPANDTESTGGDPGDEQNTSSVTGDPLVDDRRDAPGVAVPAALAALALAAARRRYP